MQTISLIAAGLVIVYLIACLTLWAGESLFIYHPDPRRTTPQAAGLQAADRTQVLEVKTGDGQTLVAWYVDSGPSAPLALFFHGNGGTLRHVVDPIDQLAAFGLTVLAIDYRGYGGSTGWPSEKGLLIDAEAALAYVTSLGRRSDQILLVGQSLGSGVAVQLAARHRFAGVLLDSPFSSIEDVAANMLPMFPVRLLLRDRFRSDRFIGAIDAPLMIVHGDNDWTVPFRFGEKLFAAARDPKTFVRLPGGAHLTIGEPEVEAPIRGWIAGLQLGAPLAAAVAQPAP
ncbi:MAG: alpha/beta hydrolase [Ancalomicrobiaceae bacterium]|nr:alpha/beta hydrolase [Ancalomicrobiaceae bacterium]